MWLWAGLVKVGHKQRLSWPVFISVVWRLLSDTPDTEQFKAGHVPHVKERSLIHFLTLYGYDCIRIGGNVVQVFVDKPPP